MKNRKLFKTDKKSFIFEDSDSPETFLCMDQENLHEVNKIAEQYNNNEEEVPDKYIIKAFPIQHTGEKENFCDVYEISSGEAIDFPINRIKWMWLQII